MSQLRQLFKSVFTAALPKSLLLTHGPRRRTRGIDIPRSPCEIALTFDDGPHPEHTPRLLDLLADAGARATFFVVGERAEQHPGLIRRIADEGHELGNHTWTHSEPSQTSAARFLEEVAQTRRLIQDLASHDCRLTRPPKGALTIRKALGLWRQQQTVALWNVDPKDFSMLDTAAMSQWLGGYRPQSGDIVLLHDNHPRTAVAVEQLVENHALRFVTLSDWLHPTQRVSEEIVAGTLRVPSDDLEPLRMINDLSNTDGTRSVPATTQLEVADAR